MKTAQILIVGDEILTGRTADTNSNFLARALFVRGVRTLRIAVVPDNVVLISQWVRDCHGLSDFTFVCGGIGGTPDDVTREAVARGVGVELVRHPEAEATLLRYYKDRMNADRMLMADLPQGCTLIKNPVTHAPGFKIRNIYVFAGIPKILHAMWNEVKHEIEGAPLFEESLDMFVGEGDIAKDMKQVNKEFPSLELGSYPNIEPATDRPYRTQMVFRANDEVTVKAALKRFKDLVGRAAYDSRE